MKGWSHSHKPNIAEFEQDWRCEAGAAHAPEAYDVFEHLEAFVIHGKSIQGAPKGGGSAVTKGGR